MLLLGRESAGRLSVGAPNNAYTAHPSQSSRAKRTAPNTCELLAWVKSDTTGACPLEACFRSARSALSCLPSHARRSGLGERGQQSTTAIRCAHVGAIASPSLAGFLLWCRLDLDESRRRRHRGESGSCLVVLLRLRRQLERDQPVELLHLVANLCDLNCETNEVATSVAGARTVRVLVCLAERSDVIFDTPDRRHQARGGEGLPHHGPWPHVRDERSASSG